MMVKIGRIWKEQRIA